MVGFVFFPPSPRHLALETARELGNIARRRALKVALTVDTHEPLVVLALAKQPQKHNAGPVVKGAKEQTSGDLSISAMAAKPASGASRASV